MEAFMGTAKILIVDDELIMRESLAGWLERDGHQIDKAASGEEALEMLEKTLYDILLLDIKMDGMSGLDVLKQVHENDPDVAVVMITAYGSVSTAIEAMKNGAFDYLMKPFDPNELGHFGIYGGRFVPETLMPALEQLRLDYEVVRFDKAFWSEVDYYYKHYCSLHCKFDLQRHKQN
jgi:CheY-like chemotaxis protein